MNQQDSSRDSWQPLVQFWQCLCLYSLVSSQQEESNKWKKRAIKLKVKSKTEVDMPSSPCTPTKRGLPMTSDSTNLLSSPKRCLVTPKKIVDSPRKLLDSPKSRFFDVGGTSELLSRTCPKQFFDNSCLGTIPGKLHLKFICNVLQLLLSCSLFISLQKVFFTSWKIQAVCFARDFPCSWHNRCREER